MIAAGLVAAPALAGTVLAVTAMVCGYQPLSFDAVSLARHRWVSDLYSSRQPSSTALK